MLTYGAEWASLEQIMGGAVAEWVIEANRALDRRPGGPGFEYRCGNFASELWQFRLPHFTWCLSEEEGEVKDPSSLHWKCVTCDSHS